MYLCCAFANSVSLFLDQPGNEKLNAFRGDLSVQRSVLLDQINRELESNKLDCWWQEWSVCRSRAPRMGSQAMLSLVRLEEANSLSRLRLARLSGLQGVDREIFRRIGIRNAGRV